VPSEWWDRFVLDVVSFDHTKEWSNTEYPPGLPPAEYVSGIMVLRRYFDEHSIAPKIVPVPEDVEAELMALIAQGQFTDAENRLQEIGMGAVESSSWVCARRPPVEWPERPAPSVPCPYCGEILKSDMAQQCFACGMDWHDASHPIRRGS
jgi:hypothetical protein